LLKRLREANVPLDVAQRHIEAWTESSGASD
jgi:hypothetical protein